MDRYIFVRVCFVSAQLPWKTILFFLMSFLPFSANSWPFPRKSMILDSRQLSGFDIFNQTVINCIQRAMEDFCISGCCWVTFALKTGMVLRSVSCDRLYMSTGSFTQRVVRAKCCLESAYHDNRGMWNWAWIERLQIKLWCTCTVHVQVPCMFTSTLSQQPTFAI